MLSARPAATGRWSPISEARSVRTGAFTSRVGAISSPRGSISGRRELRAHRGASAQERGGPSRRGAPVKAAQEHLGHATIETTMSASQLSPLVGRGAARLLDPATRRPEGLRWNEQKRNGRRRQPRSYRDARWLHGLKRKRSSEISGEIQWRRRESNPGPQGFQITFVHVRSRFTLAAGFANSVATYLSLSRSRYRELSRATQP
jgi:hypothetical protein